MIAPKILPYSLTWPISMIASTHQKIWFLQFARAIACLAVVYTHWLSLLLSPNDIKQFILQNPLMNYQPPALHDYVGEITALLGMTSFRSSYFGVGLFFILSGYVIPMSLKNSSPKQFFVRRVFRIYPVAICCLTIAAVTMTAAHYWQCGEISYRFISPRVYFANTLLMKFFVRTTSIDDAIWTLHIEILFYFIFFLLLFWNVHQKTRSILILAFLFFFSGMAHLLARHWYTMPFIQLHRFISHNGAFIPFMLVGTCFYYFSDKIFKPVAAGAIILLLLLVTYLNLHGEFPEDYSVRFINNLYVFLFFVFLYIINNYLPYSKFFDKLADISFSLYLLHGFTTYTLYFVSYQLTGSILFSAIASFSLAIVLSIFLHHFVEKPFISLSKNIILAKENKKVHLLNASFPHS